MGDEYPSYSSTTFVFHLELFFLSSNVFSYTFTKILHPLSEDIFLDSCYPRPNLHSSSSSIALVEQMLGELEQRSLLSLA
jgi:hypothetical protein